MPSPAAPQIIATAPVAKAPAGPAAASAAVSAPKSPATTPPAAPQAIANTRGRAHFPIVALLAGLVIPGAGQAYNGQPIKGFFLLLVSPLVLPQIYALWNAWTEAARIQKEGGRYGKGGFVWIALQGWLELNAVAACILILTIVGVLR